MLKSEPSEWDWVECRACKGSGEELAEDDEGAFTVDCKACKGSGEVREACKGSGEVRGKMKKFIIRYEAEATLDVKALWPDGDAPENPTEDDVRELIESCGGIHRVLDDWNLGDRDLYEVVEE
ncbi:MAG: hypothetical protein EBS53_00225 [Bacteroidetes bacterium]|nr:hypothetical protein [Bacteroidota bacterium]